MRHPDRVTIARFKPGKPAGRRWCFAYSRSRALDPNRHAGGAFGYLGSDFSPTGHRWAWCDDVAPRIRHRGWYTDPEDAGDTIRGLVVRLNHGRGFLAGWSMGESMATSVDTLHIYDDDTDAAHAADDLARRAAELEQEMEHAEN